MNRDIPSQYRMNGWLIGLIIFLSGIILVEGGIIFFMKYDASGEKHGILRRLLPNRWMPIHHPREPSLAKEDRMILLEPAQDITSIHDQINQLFSSLSDPGVVSRPHSSASPATDHLSRLQQDINRIFENVLFDDLDIFNLPDRLEQGWNTSDISSSMHINDQDTHYLVQMDLPNLETSTLAISLQGRLLSITANQDMNRQPQAAGSDMTGTYTRKRHLEVLLPGPVDAVNAQATYQDNILHIKIPKGMEQDPLARTIKVI